MKTRPVEQLVELLEPPREASELVAAVLVVHQTRDQLLAQEQEGPG